MAVKLDATDQELAEKFRALQDRKSVADLLEVEDKSLVYWLYRLPDSKKYERFEMPKRSGQTRTILSPTSSLKALQQRLHYVLSLIYKPRTIVKGFVKEQSIVTNAEAHIGQRYVLNVDIEDFFPSINFGRVRGLFVSKPYNLPATVATVLAQICCFQNQLPQGAPTSPIVSNMLCAAMDAQLQNLAKRYRCIYTRYADDITFST